MWALIREPLRASVNVLGEDPLPTWRLAASTVPDATFRR